MNVTRTAARIFSREARLAASLLCALTVFAAVSARADGAADRRRALMAGIKRIAIVPPFFGTDTLERAQSRPAPGENHDKKPSPRAEPQLATYADQLRRLAAHDAMQLPQRAADRLPYEIVPAEETARALKELELTADRLFAAKDPLHGARYSSPDVPAVRRLAERLHVQALALVVLDEPRNTSGHYTYNPLSGIDYSSAHVEARGTLFVAMADGAEALHSAVSALHPVTRIGNRTFFLTDLTEAQDLMIEDMFDEWTQYTPTKSHD